MIFMHRSRQPKAAVTPGYFYFEFLFNKLNNFLWRRGKLGSLS